MSPPYASRGTESPTLFDQYSSPSPVDLDIEAAMDPKPPKDHHHHEKADGTEENKSQGVTLEDEELTVEEQKERAYYVEKLEPEEHPQHFSSLRKFIIVFIISSGALCSTCASSMVRIVTFY